MIRALEMLLDDLARVEQETEDSEVLRKRVVRFLSYVQHASDAQE